MADLRARIAKLRALADDPAASPNERTVARTVAERLERRVQVAAVPADEDAIWDSHGRVRQAAWREAVSSLDPLPIDAPWPPAWTGPRTRVEFEAALNGDEYVLVWDCPACGMIVSRVVTLRHIYRMIGAKVDPLAAVRSMMDGRANQLCVECTRKHGG